MLNTNHDDAIHYVNGLLKMPRPEKFHEVCWFSTLQEPGDETQKAPIKKRILPELIALQKLQQLNQQDSQKSNNQFFSSCSETDTTLNKKARQTVEELLVDFHEIVARHSLNIRIFHDFKMKLTDLDESPAYSQSLTTPTNLEKDIKVELVPLHQQGIISIPPFSKYANPILAQRRPNGKLRPLVGLRKTNNRV